MKPYIEIDIDENGDVVIEAKGYNGPLCEAATREIEQALGTVTRKQRTPAFYAKQTTQQRQSTSAG